MQDVLFHHDEKSVEKINRWIKTLPEPKSPNSHGHLRPAKRIRQHLPYRTKRKDRKFKKGQRKCLRPIIEYD